jgi:hypothetical protein
MTVRGRSRGNHAVSTGVRVAAECRRSGDWRPAAAWLAAELNTIDAAPGCLQLDGAGRSYRRDSIDDRVGQVDGDYREIDVILLRDGSRVCWHLGATRRATRWVVEGRSEDCPYPGLG